MQRVVLSPVYAIVVLSQVQNVVVSPVYAIVVLSQVQNVVLSPWTPPIKSNLATDSCESHHRGLYRGTFWLRKMKSEK